jgi:hypothetical protein
VAGRTHRVYPPPSIRLKMLQKADRLTINIGRKFLKKPQGSKGTDSVKRFKMSMKGLRYQKT